MGRKCIINGPKTNVSQKKHILGVFEPIWSVLDWPKSEIDPLIGDPKDKKPKLAQCSKMLNLFLGLLMWP